MSRRVRLATMLAAAVGLASAFATPAAAQGGVNVGNLTCNVSSGWGFVFGSSRALNCTFAGAGGPVKQSPCALTDGNLGTSLQPLAAAPCPSGQMCTPPQQNNWVYIDLGSATAITALVLYDVAFGSSSSAVVEGSADGTTWTALAAPVSSQPYQLVPLSGTARYVRLRLADATAQLPAFGNSEIAIY